MSAPLPRKGHGAGDVNYACKVRSSTDGAVTHFEREFFSAEPAQICLVQEITYPLLPYLKNGVVAQKGGSDRAESVSFRFRASRLVGAK